MRGGKGSKLFGDFLSGKSFFQPVLAVHKPGDNERDHIVASGVNHGRGRIHQVADGHQDGEGQLHLGGEEDGADDVLADVAAAGHAGHTNRGKDSHQNDLDEHADALKGDAEHAKDEGDFQDTREAGAVHMHGGAQRQHHVGDILGDAGVLGGFHVGGDGGHGGAGTQGHHGRPEDVAEHFARTVLAAAEEGEEGEGGEDIDRTEGIVHCQGAAIVGGNLRAIGGHQIGKEAEEGDRGVVGDNLDELHHHVGQVVQPLAHHGVLAAVEVDGEAEEQGEDNERQHGLAAQKAHKVLGGEEVDNHLREGGVFAQLFSGDVLPGHENRGDEAHEHVHDGGGDGACDHEGADGDAHDFSGALAAAHIGHGTGDGREDHGHHDAEHHVDEHRAQRLEHLGAGTLLSGGEQGAHHAAGHNGNKHGREQAVILEPAGLLAMR